MTDRLLSLSIKHVINMLVLLSLLLVTSSLHSAPLFNYSTKSKVVGQMKKGAQMQRSMDLYLRNAA